MKCKNKYLEDTKGNKSSKRLCGFLLIVLSLLMSIILFCFSIFSGAKDPDTAVRIINSLLTGAGFLLGIGVAEHFKISKK